MTHTLLPKTSNLRHPPHTDSIIRINPPFNQPITSSLPIQIPTVDRTLPDSNFTSPMSATSPNIPTTFDQINSWVTITSPPNIPTNLTTISVPPQNHHPMITRSKHGIQCPNHHYLLTCEPIPKKPKSVKTTLRHLGWKHAMETELKAFVDQDAFESVPHNPDICVLGSKWIWKTKLK